MVLRSFLTSSTHHIIQPIKLRYISKYGNPSFTSLMIRVRVKHALACPQETSTFTSLMIRVRVKPYPVQPTQSAPFTYLELEYI